VFPELRILNGLAAGYFGSAHLKGLTFVSKGRFLELRIPKDLEDGRSVNYRFYNALSEEPLQRGGQRLDAVVYREYFTSRGISLSRKKFRAEHRGSGTYCHILS
jgi:hypothetical protein